MLGRHAPLRSNSGRKPCHWAWSPFSKYFRPFTIASSRLRDAIQNGLRLRIHGTPSTSDMPPPTPPADTHPPEQVRPLPLARKDLDILDLEKSRILLSILQCRTKHSNIKSSGYGTRLGSAVSQRKQRANPTPRVYSPTPTPWTSTTCDTTFHVAKDFGRNWPRSHIQTITTGKALRRTRRFLCRGALSGIRSLAT